MFQQIKLASILFVLCLGIFCYGFYENSKQNYIMSRGNYFFDKTRDTPYIKKIVLKSHDNHSVTFKQIDNFWRIEEADDYFAHPARANALINLMRDTIIYRADPKPLEQNDIAQFEKAIEITTFDKDNHLIDKALIAPKLQNNLFHYALLNDNDILYQIVGNFNLSSYFVDWFQFPILVIQSQDISSIKSDSFYVYKNSSDDEFKYTENDKIAHGVERLLRQFWYLGANNIKHSIHFNTHDYNKIKEYEITLFNGVIFNISLYYKDEQYWISIKLDKTILTSNTALEFIENNTHLYDGWFFNISKSIGEALATFSI